MLWPPCEMTFNGVIVQWQSLGSAWKIGTSFSALLLMSEPISYLMGPTQLGSAPHSSEAVPRKSQAPALHREYECCCWEGRGGPRNL